MESADLLQISGQLDYVFVSNSELKQAISLRNNLNDGRGVAFKVKTSAVNRYMVRPTVGVVPPGASLNVRIYMVAQQQYSDDLRNCKDRFLIQCAPTDLPSVADVTPEVFNSSLRQDIKLKVTVAPPLALRSVLEGEIRAFAAQQGVDGHRQCMRKFLELLLARGVLSQSQVLLAFGVVAELFNGVKDASAESLDVKRADGVSRWTSRGALGSFPSPRLPGQNSASSSGGRVLSPNSPPSAEATLRPQRMDASGSGVSPREHIFQPDPEAKPLFPSVHGVAQTPPTVTLGYSPAGRTTPPSGKGSPAATPLPSGLRRAGSGPENALMRGRIDSTGSTASESGSGIAEPPPTPTVTPSSSTVQAASKLFTSSLADRFALSSFKVDGKKGRAASKQIPSRRVTDDNSDEEFQDASETLPEPAPSIKIA